MAIVLTGMGVFVLVPALRDLIFSVTQLTLQSEAMIRRGQDLWQSPNWHANFWSALVGVGLSAGLIFGSRGLARLIHWVRFAAAD
jgi:hypothetical protein